MNPMASLQGAAVRFGSRVLFEDLDLRIEPGEFLAVLGPNGAGKTTFLRVLLGRTPVSSGRVAVDARIGYIPQQQAFDRELPIRGRDLVRLGVDGHRPGMLFTPRHIRARVDDAIRAVDAATFANSPIGLCSGGEQQRIRIAQALVTDPQLLLCDEPLLSLDLSQQGAVSELIDRRRREHNTAVVFVTHEINPILPYVDRVLYLVDGKWAVGAPSEVLTGPRLSELYHTTVDVLEVRGRLVVVGADEGSHHP